MHNSTGGCECLLLAPCDQSALLTAFLTGVIRLGKIKLPDSGLTRPPLSPLRGHHNFQKADIQREAKGQSRLSVGLGQQPTCGEMQTMLDTNWRTAK